MIRITSFGYLHGSVPAGVDLLLDARNLIRDPHVDPELRELTGRDEAAQVAIMRTPGAQALVDLLAQAAIYADEVTGPMTGRAAHVAIGCQVGRHRSVVLADHLARVLADTGRSVDVQHRDVDRPVVDRPAAR